MRDILLFGITGPVLIAALMRPFVGMLAYVAYSFIGPHSYTYGMARSFSHVQAIAICTLVGYFLSPERKQLPKQREVILFIALWAVFGISTIDAIMPARAFDHLYKVSKIFLMIVLAMAMINTEERLHLFAKAIAISIGFYGLKAGLFVVLSGGVAAIEGPEDSFLQSNNALGMAMAMNVPLLFYLAKVEGNKWLRWLMQLMFLLSYPAVAGTFSRGAWLGLAVATGLMVLKSKSTKMKIAAALVLFLAVAVVVPTITSQELQDRFSSFGKLDEDSSAQGRFWTWNFCWRVGSAYPILGGGFDYYSIETYAQFLPEFLEKFPGKMWSCHNMWLTIWGELGLVGAAVWGSLLVSVLVSLHKLNRHSNIYQGSPWISAYANMIQLAFVVYMVCGTFLDIAYFEIYYFLIALVILIKERVREALEKDVMKRKVLSSEENVSLARNPIFAGCDPPPILQTPP